MEVYLYDLGLSSEFLEIKKNKQKKKDKLDLAKLKNLWSLEYEK